MINDDLFGAVILAFTVAYLFTLSATNLPKNF